MAYPTGKAVTAIITMTAGAHSIQPSLRSARAPSDSCGFRRPAGSSIASEAATVPTASLIGPFPPSLPAGRTLCGGSRDQTLRLQAVADLADHRFLGARRVDGGRRREQVRDVDGHDLVDGRLRPDTRVLQRLQDVGVEWVVLEQRRVVVEAGDRRRDAADVGPDDLVLLVTQAQRGLEGERLVLRVGTDPEVPPADRHLGRHARGDLRVERVLE